MAGAKLIFAADLPPDLQVGFARPGAAYDVTVRFSNAASAMQSAKLVKSSTLKVYPGLSHGMCTINKDQINADLLAFMKS